MMAPLTPNRYFSLYVSESENYFKLISPLLKNAEKNQTELLRIAHSMKGMAKALQLESHVDELFEIENLIEKKDFSKLSSALAHFKKTLDTWAKQNPTHESEDEITVSNLLTQLEKQTRSRGIAILLLRDSVIPKNLESKFLIWLTVLVNNSIDHAFSQLTPSPELTLSSREEEGTITLTLEDNGRGFPLAELAAKAPPDLRHDLLKLSKKRSPLSSQELDLVLEAICLHQLTTSASVTTTSGRGVGLSTFRKDLTELGGRLELGHTGPTGTAFRLIIPRRKI